jgi:hypothetical protein
MGSFLEGDLTVAERNAQVRMGWRGIEIMSSIEKKMNRNFGLSRDNTANAVIKRV